MRAAVITLHHVCNYGTQLQVYATQEKLKQYFDEVIFIDYRRPDTYGRKLLRTFTKGNPIKIPIILPTLIYWRYLFGGFRKQHLNLTNKIYLDDSDFEYFEDCADVYFSGSDQVWNTGWNNGIIPAFYLSFAPDDTPKIAYSSSFGKDTITDLEVMKTKKYFERYQAISVREKSGLTILKNQYKNSKATRLVDPTLCMTPSFWRNIAPLKKIDSKYILMYSLNRNHEFDIYAKELSRRTGLKLYRLCTRFDQIIQNGKSIVIPDIFNFITLIDNAKYVLTDSFHATAFAMNLNTEPICIYPKKYSGRISEFLELVDSQQRHVLGNKDFDVVNRSVNFSKVNQILEKERKRADEFLQNIVKGDFQDAFK